MKRTAPVVDGEGDPTLKKCRTNKMIQLVGSNKAANLLKEWLAENGNLNPELDEKIFLAQESGIDLRKVKTFLFIVILNDYI